MPVPRHTTVPRALRATTISPIRVGCLSFFGVAVVVWGLAFAIHSLTPVIVTFAVLTLFTALALLIEWIAEVAARRRFTTTTPKETHL